MFNLTEFFVVRLVVDFIGKQDIGIARRFLKIRKFLERIWNFKKGHHENKNNSKNLLRLRPEVLSNLCWILTIGIFVMLYIFINKRVYIKAHAQKIVQLRLSFHFIHVHFPLIYAWNLKLLGVIQLRLFFQSFKL